MFLTAYNVPHYLMSKGLISAESVVAGDFTLAEAGRRNRNFKIIRRTQPGLFLKQIKTTEQQAIVTIQREAAFYRAVEADPKYAAIRKLIPRYVDFDAARNALTLSLAENTESMAEQHAREGRYPESSAQMLGWALGVAHSHGPTIVADPALRPVFPCQIPWPLALDQTGYSFLYGFGPVGAQLKQAIQQFPTLQPKLSALRQSWQYDSLIHGDMKWDNCLVSRRAGGESEVTIVDWELADIGDGAWDVATIFKEYIVATILQSHARQIETLQPSIRAFWMAYGAARSFTAEQARAYLERAVCYTAGRMIIAVLEYLTASPQYGALIPAMLQAGVNMLDAPQLSAVQLIGMQIA
jgi:phosphotransferase family enzyme